MISEHFSLEELTLSPSGERAGLNNTPSAEILATMTTVLVPGLELVRDILGKPMHINSGYRSREVNTLIGGAPSSQHMRGEAADFICPGFGSPFEVCNELIRHKEAVHFDQLIYECTWVHVSFTRGVARGQLLTANFASGHVAYSPGIHP
jgi:hypothetical protein